MNITAPIIKNQLTKKLKARKPRAIREKITTLALNFLFIFPNNNILHLQKVLGELSYEYLDTDYLIWESNS